MKEYRLKQWYPTLPTEWHGEENIIVVERGYKDTVYELHPSLKGTTRFATLTEREVERNEEFWQEVVAKDYKVPLFTTEDGVDVFKGDKVYYVETEDMESANYKVNEYTVKESGRFTSDKSLHAFSTKEKAEEYILMNKPCLSLNDLLDFWGSGDIEDYMSSPMFKNFKKVAQNKIKK